jgi:two-component system, NarL family, nitrate/nitrite response regulator NarL
VARLILGDQHVLFLDALSGVLREHGHETGPVARSTLEMIDRVSSEQPGLCLIDRHGVAGDGGDSRTIGVIGQVLEAGSGTRVLVVGADPAIEAARRAVDAGASGYLHQSQGICELTSAIDRVLGGEVVTGIPHRVPSPRAAAPDLAMRRAADLTSRERQCLMMLVDGLDTVAITRQLEVSRTTARTHLQSILTKLGVHSRLEAVSFAIRYRLPDLWPEASLRPAPGPALPAEPPWRQEPDLSDSHLAAGLAPRFWRRVVPAAGRRGRPALAWQS